MKNLDNHQNSNGPPSKNKSEVRIEMRKEANEAS
jgi:hypothetical protein